MDKQSATSRRTSQRSFSALTELSWWKEKADMAHENSDGVEHPIGSTNAQPGEGRPRLIFKVGSGQGNEVEPRQFDLLHPTTTIGSGSEMHLNLEGLAPFHAEIRHDDDDEYVLYIHDTADSQSEPASPTGEGADTGSRILRTGSPVELGDWAMSFYREEFADHGRPFGGRQGGEGEVQLDQDGQPLGE